MLAQFDITGVRLETDRLILRPWQEEDLEDFYIYASVDGVGEMAGWVHHGSREDSARVLRHFIEEKKTFALELKETGRVIGSLGVEEYNPQEFGDPEGYGRELGYVLSRDYWGRGLMSEAVGEVIRYCFGVLCYDFLVCGHFLRNDRSRRVIEKSGFVFLREVIYKTNYETAEPTALYLLRNRKG